MQVVRILIQSKEFQLLPLWSSKKIFDLLFDAFFSLNIFRPDVWRLSKYQTKNRYLLFRL